MAPYTETSDIDFTRLFNHFAESTTCVCQTIRNSETKFEERSRIQKLIPFKMGRGKGQGYGRLQEVDIVLYHAKTAERVIVMTFHCIKWSKCISVLFTYYFEGSEFSRNGGGGGGEGSRAGGSAARKFFPNTHK